MYSRILVPLDGSKLAECVLPHLREIAGGCGTGEIILLRVCEPLAVLADYPEADMRESWDEHVKEEMGHGEQRCRLYLNNVERSLREMGLKVTVETHQGDAAREIADYADNNEIDLIIMASHGRSGISRWAYGSVAEKVLRASKAPVMMVKAPGTISGT